MTEKTPLTTVIEGKSILTFYKDQNNLCCRKFETSTGSWAEQETLVQHFGQEYAATVGSKRTIH